VKILAVEGVAEFAVVDALDDRGALDTVVPLLEAKLGVIAVQVPRLAHLDVFKVPMLRKNNNSMSGLNKSYSSKDRCLLVGGGH